MQNEEQRNGEGKPGVDKSQTHQYDRKEMSVFLQDSTIIQHRWDGEIFIFSAPLKNFQDVRP